MNRLIKELYHQNQSSNSDKEKIKEVISLLDRSHSLMQTVEGRESSLVKTKLEEAALWLEQYLRNV